MIRSIKGSLVLYLRLPLRTECSSMWQMPVLSSRTVLKPIEKALLSSSFSIFKTRAPVFSCSNNLALDLYSSSHSSLINLYPLYIYTSKFQSYPRNSASESEDQSILRPRLLANQLKAWKLFCQPPWPALIKISPCVRFQYLWPGPK